jgi:hypothetical protein
MMASPFYILFYFKTQTPDLTITHFVTSPSLGL